MSALLNAVAAVTTSAVAPNLAEIKRAIKVLFERGQTVELRALKTPKKTISGCYRDFEKLAADACEISRLPAVPAVYWTLQECKPAVYSRSADQAKPYANSTTGDHDIAKYRWLLVDCDPQRPSGISSTDEEKEASHEVALAVRDYFSFINSLDGYPSILADSGNGYHVLLRIDLDSSDSSKKLIEKVLKVLDQQFSTETIKVDTSVFNPSRICKAYGTVVRKGSDTPERPHRVAKMLEVPTELVVVPREVLERIASAHKLPNNTAPASKLSRSDLEQTAAKMEQFLSEAQTQHGNRLDYDGGYKWQLESCPFNSDHKSPDAFVLVKPNGVLIFSCSHNSCKENWWKPFRELAEKTIGHHFAFKDTYQKPDSAKQETKPPHKKSDERRVLEFHHFPTEEEKATRTAFDYVLAPIAETERNFDGWFPLGSPSLIGGSSGSGKTTFMLDLCITQRMGAPFYKHPTFSRPFLVLMLDRGELSHVRTMRRMGFLKTQVPIRVMKAVLDSDASQEIINQLETDPNNIPQILFIEGIDMLVSDPNSLPPVTAFMHEMQQIATHFHIAIIGSCGAPKTKANETYAAKRDTVFGSAVWSRKSETIVTIQYPGGDDTADGRVISTLPRNNKAETLCAVFESGRLVEAPQPQESEKHIQPKMQTAIDFLRRELKDGPKVGKELQDKAHRTENIQRSTIYEAAKLMHVNTDAGTVGEGRKKQNLWQLTPGRAGADEPDEPQTEVF